MNPIQKSILTLALSGPALVSAKAQPQEFRCIKSASDQKESVELTVKLNALKGRLGLTVTEGEHFTSTALSGSCNPVIGFSTVQIRSSGNMVENIQISGDSYSVCRLNSYTKIRLLLEKDFLGGSFVVKSLQVGQNYSTGEMEVPELESIEKVVDAVCEPF